MAKRCASRRGRGAWTVGAGLTMYDLLSWGSAWPRHRMVRAGLPGMPGVDAARYPQACLYTDAQMLFPERFTVELLIDARRIAASRGIPFAVITRAGARLEADGRLRVMSGMSGMGLGDAGAALLLAPRSLVNATGAWVDRTLGELLPERTGGEQRRLIGGTKGSHLLIDSSQLRRALGSRGVYAEAADGRPMFVLPFGGRLVLVGTTDIPFSGDPATARADDAEIDYLLAAVGVLFPAVAPRRSDVVQHYCGVRPLPATDGAPAGITRRHMIVRRAGAPLPLWSIVGGKLTTCRSLAESAAAEILTALSMPVTATSRDRPLPGAVSAAARERIESPVAAWLEDAGLEPAEAKEAARATVDLLGTAALELIGMEGGLLAGSWLPTAAVHYCLASEWATTLDDLIERRLMLAFDPDLASRTLRAVADAMVRAGAMESDAVEGEIATMTATLKQRYGKQLRGDTGEGHVDPLSRQDTDYPEKEPRHGR